MLLVFLLQLAAAQPTRFELPNGLRVWIQEDHRRPVALVQVTYKIGALNEAPGQTGLAHYVEHMVYRATQHIRNEDVYGYIDRIGGRYTGGTWPEVTRYGETVPSWAVESALRVTAERMCCALFDSTEFERERHNVVTEANGFSETDALAVMRDAVLYAAFDVHPYRLNSDSWARDNLLLTRDQAFRWYKDHYGPNNAVLVVVGDVSAEDVRQLVERQFASIPRAPESGEIRVVEPPQRAEKRVTVTAPEVRPEIDVAYHAPGARHGDFAALTVVTRLLQQRLPAAMRRAGVAGFAVVSDSASQYPYLLRVELHADSIATDQPLDVLDREVSRLASGDVSEAELVAARAPTVPVDSATNAASGSVPPRRSYLTNIADELTDREALPWELTPAQARRARAGAQSVTPSDVASYAQRWLRPSQRTVGILRAGRSDFLAAWTDARPVVGERIEIPPLTTPPAKRERPAPVPERALQPLPALPITVTRRQPTTGVTVASAAMPSGVDAPYIRLECDCSDTLRVHAAERLLRADTALTNAHVAMTVAGRDDNPADSSAEKVARRRALRAVQPAVAAPSERLIASLVTNARDTWVSDHVARSLARLAPVAPSWLRTPGRPMRRDTASEERIKLARETQVAIVASLPGVPRDHPDRRALELLSYIVGVPSYGGRLGWALTKSGLTYAAAATNDFGAHSGSILLATKCDTRNTDAVIQAIREVVEGIAARGAEEWELREAQAFMLGRTILYGARADSDPAVVAAAVARSEFGALELDPPALSRAYLSVTLEELNRVARRYYRPDALHIVAVGALPSGGRSPFPPGTFLALFAS